MASLKSINLGLRDKLNDKDYRDRFFNTLVQDEVAEQIRTLREKRNMRQKDVASITGMKQSAVSRLEKSEHSAWNFKTLLRLASALDARVRIVFQPAEDAIGEIARTEMDAAEAANGSCVIEDARRASVDAALGGDKRALPGTLPPNSPPIRDFPHGQGRDPFRKERSPFPRGRQTGIAG